MILHTSAAPAGARSSRTYLRVSLLLQLLALAACSAGSNSGGSSPTPGSTYYTIGGTISGLNGTGLVLQNNNGDNLTVGAGSGSFAFATSLASGNSYSVSILTQPNSPNQTCVVTSGSGTVDAANVAGVSVTCANQTAATDTIGGTVTGLVGSGLVLQNNGADNLPVSGGSFTFATGLPVGVPY